MKSLFLLRLAFRIILVTCVIAIAANQASACKCGSAFHGKDAWDVAKLESQGTAAVFEGVPERFELQWSLLSAKNGALISTNGNEGGVNNYPRMLITFRVQRAYKGDLGPELQVSTGLGGGDCGSDFAPGLTYLVYADGPNVHELTVYLCSPGGWIGSNTVATELRYLRKERPNSGDIEPNRPWTVAESSERTKRRESEYKAQQELYAAATGRICGTVVPENPKTETHGLLSFLSVKGYSPAQPPTAEVRNGGSFCSGDLGPGKYFLHYMSGSAEGLTAATYFPGVTDSSNAAPVEIIAGQTRSGLIFKVPKQKTYSVRGFVSSDESPVPSAGDFYVELVGANGFPFSTGDTQKIDFRGWFSLPKAKYFQLDNVLPGHYIAFVAGVAPGWYTRKVEMSVEDHAKFISLELRHKK